jgi:hypothetical protein
MIRSFLPVGLPSIHRIKRDEIMEHFLGTMGVVDPAGAGGGQNNASFP